MPHMLDFSYYMLNTKLDRDGLNSLASRNFLNILFLAEPTIKISQS